MKIKIISLLLFLTFTSCEKEYYCRPYLKEGACCQYGTPVADGLDTMRADTYCFPPGCDCDTTLTVKEYWLLWSDI